VLDTIRWQILLVALAGWVNRHQLKVMAYLREENRVLNEHLGRRRLHFTDLDPTATLTPDEAIATVARTVGGAITVDESPELVVLPRDDGTP
jgi:hypothetical protein